MIAERIIKECTQYLLHSNLSISEIAYSLGFENIAYFSKFYRKHTGKTPSEIREQ
jgi:YesN/AraC family two-component response regulator